MDQRDEFEFGGFGCLHAVWFWLPIALLGGGYWLVRQDSAVAAAAGIASLGLAVAWLAVELVVRRRRR